MLIIGCNLGYIRRLSWNFIIDLAEILGIKHILLHGHPKLRCLQEQHPQHRTQSGVLMSIFQ